MSHSPRHSRGLRLAALLVLVALTAAGGLTAGAALAARGERAAQTDPRPKLADVAWLAGHWRSAGERASVEELWMPPRGGLMLGLNRTVPAKGRAAFEFLRIEERAGAVVYHASPQGGAAVPFRLVEADGTHAVFTNPEHDFPKRIEYRLAEGKLVAAIAGDTPGPSWTFERVGAVE